MTTFSLNRTAGPAAEPVSLVEAKKQLELATSDTTHDDAITDYIIAAREQIEHDTDFVGVTQTFTLDFDQWPNDCKFSIPVQPIQSVTSITYYDEGNSQQTLATTVYGVDAPRRWIYLKYDQEWPDITVQHNGIQVTFVAGFGNATEVSRLIRQAILLQVTKWFQHRGDESEMPAHDTAYERIIARIMRTSYP